MRLALPVARGILVLGIVSLLTDVAGEMTQPLLPLYLASLGVGALGIGAVEGAAEAAVSVVKVASGRLADRWPRRKPLVVAGYALAAVAKPGLGLAATWSAVLGLRTLDRVGKGMRGAPRDAMIGDMAAQGQRGLAFGFHRAADTIGAILGPLISLALLAAWGQSEGAIRNVFLVTAVPMFLAVALLVVAVREPAVHRVKSPARAAVPPGYRAWLGVAALFSLGNVSYAFLLLRTVTLGASELEAVALYVLFNMVYAAASVPLGRLSDRVGRAPVLRGSMVVFAATAVGFALAPGWLWTLPLFALYGVFMAAFETVSRAYAVDLAPAEARATAIGLYHATVGLVALPAGLLAGFLWERAGAPAPFLAGAALALLAVALVPWAARRAGGAAAPAA